MQWEVEQVQGVVFLPSQPRNALEIWTDLFERSPDEFQKRKFGPTEGSVAAGVEGGMTVQVVSQPGRCEFLVRAHDPSPQSSELVPNLADVDGALTLARSLTLKLAKGVDVSRIGALANLVLPVASPSEGVRLLNTKLGKEIFLPDATDLLIQSNVPKPSTVDSAVVVNEICKWGAGVQQSLLIAFDQTGKPVSDPLSSNKRHVVFLHLDVNTSPDAMLMQMATKFVDELWDRVERLRSEAR